MYKMLKSAVYFVVMFNKLICVRGARRGLPTNWSVESEFLSPEFVDFAGLEVGARVKKISQL